MLWIRTNAWSVMHVCEWVCACRVRRSCPDDTHMQSCRHAEQTPNNSEHALFGFFLVQRTLNFFFNSLAIIIIDRDTFKCDTHLWSLPPVFFGVRDAEQYIGSHCCGDLRWTEWDWLAGGFNRYKKQGWGSELHQRFTHFNTLLNSNAYSAYSVLKKNRYFASARLEPATPPLRVRNLFP